MLQIKFETQSLHTDDHGLPIPFRIPKIYYEYIPRWRWPPGDPMKDHERQILIDNGLFQMASWAGALVDAPGEVGPALTRELRSRVAGHLRDASPDHVARVADYVGKMGRQFRAGG